MKKFLSLVLVFGLVFSFSAVAIAQNVDDLKSSLEQSGQFNSQEVKDIEKELKKVVDAGATNEEVQQMLVDLKQQGATSDDLKAVLKQTGKMIEKGTEPQQAVTTMSDTATQAMQQGVTGKDLEKQLKDAVKAQEQGQGMSDTMGGMEGTDTGTGTGTMEDAGSGQQGTDTGTMGGTSY